MRALKLCLWITGILCLLSVLGIFLPLSAWQSIATAFGIESLPDSSLFVYMIRLISATYAAAGLFYIILARWPMKYQVLIPFSALAAVFVGMTCAITGLTVAMPVLWFLGDSVSLEHTVHYDNIQFYQATHFPNPVLETTTKFQELIHPARSNMSKMPILRTQK